MSSGFTPVGSSQSTFPSSTKSLVQRTEARSEHVFPVAGDGTGRGGVDVKKEVGEDDMEEIRKRGMWGDEWDGFISGKKRKWAMMGYDNSHMDEMELTAIQYRTAILSDQLETCHPTPNPPAFRSTEDAIQRLLPYHIYQVYDDELEGQVLEREKMEKRERTEIKEATALNDRIAKIHERFFKLRRREGTHPSHLPSLIELLRSSTFQVRLEVAELSNKYRQVQTTYSEIQNEKLARERKEAAAHASNQAFAARVRAMQTQAQAQANAQPPKPSSNQTQASSSKPTVSTPVRPPPPQAKVAPAVVTPKPAANSTPAPASSTTPNGSSASRPRGRPPKAKENGLRETVLKAGGTSQSLSATPATPARTAPSTPTPSQATPAQTKPSTNGTRSTPLNPATPSAAATSATPTTPGTPGTPTTPANASGEVKKGPVSMNIPVTVIPLFVSLGIITSPPDASKPTPGQLLRIWPDRKNATVAIELVKCTQPQLNGLAKVLGLKGKPATSTAPSTPATPSTGPSTGPKIAEKGQAKS